MREVDDGFALALAFRSPELRIVGITTTYGNAPVLITDGVAQKLAQRFGMATPIYRGASGAGDLGYNTAASEALSRALRKGKLTYVALGPLTDLATLLLLEPQLAKNIARVVFVGGRASDTVLAAGPFRFHDANVRNDPAAARVVLHSSIPLLLAPVETSLRLVATPHDLSDLAASGPEGAYLERKSRAWIWFWTHIARRDGGPLFDVLAVCALRPDLVKIDRAYAALDRNGDLIVSRERTAGSRVVQVISDFGLRTKPFIMRRLSKAR